MIKQQQQKNRRMQKATPKSLPSLQQQQQQQHHIRTTVLTPSTVMSPMVTSKAMQDSHLTIRQVMPTQPPVPQRISTIPRPPSLVTATSGKPNMPLQSRQQPGVVYRYSTPSVTPPTLRMINPLTSPYRILTPNAPPTTAQYKQAASPISPTYKINTPAPVPVSVAKPIPLGALKLIMYYLDQAGSFFSQTFTQ